MGKTIQVYGFPGLLPAETIKEFLEGFTGKGTIYALEVKQPKKGGSRAYAKVQFTTVNSADHVLSLASKRLWYGPSYLKAYASDTDIQKPKVYAYNVERVALFIGCQVSKEKFSVFWKKAGISVKFGFSLRKLYFFLEYESIDYKLELSYENIWQTELRRSQTGEFLLIQLIGAPRIFQKYEEGSVYNFVMETPDEQWIRSTDFTPSSCIGQSSGFCLKLPYGVSIPQFADYFAYYKETIGLFTLESGFPFSHNLTLVPIVGPSSGLQIPYNILFKLSMLVQAGCLPGPVLDDNFFRLVDPKKLDIVLIEHALEKLYNLKDCCYEPVKWLTEQYKNYLMLKQPPRSPSIVLDTGLVYVRRVLITPTRVYFFGPEVNMSNRVLRHYSNEIDNFLRVSFVDEELDKMHSTNLSIRIGSVEKRTGIYQRILSILRDGIDIVGKKFEFLAFSSSQLRENSAWMFASRPGLTTADIREWMGDFSEIKNIAKYAARLGQSFGSSTETLSVPRCEIETIRDIKVVTKGTEYTFSDGIGKISADFAHRVAIKCSLKVFTPSAFQIRYGGYKGVVAIDPTSSVKLSLRKSMSKYESSNEKLDVLGWSKYQPCFLNRQLISLLSTLGVEDYIFEIKQKDALKQLDSILTDPLMAQEALELMSPGENTNILKEMLLCGYMPDEEPFLSMMLRTFRAAKLLELRTKTRIFIPKARQMMGCLDETRTLEYGQVFVQFSGGPSHRHFGNRSSFLPNTESEHRRFIANGKVLVAKNPCLHPGDVRVLIAVDVPPLRHMVDCVVFPQKGKRPHPNECSGSDLDGDVYFVCWDKDLIPRQQIEPMDYTPAPSTVLDHDVTIEEVEEYFTNYILNDSLGVIANAHTVFADNEPLKALSEPCLELAQLFSIAVDFPKTGVPAAIPSHLRVKNYPDFMEKSDKPAYESKCVIGKLFRMVKGIAPHDPTSATKSFFTREMARKSYDAEMEVEDFEDYLEDAFDYKNEYDFKLGNLMDYYGIKTEAEILGGSIMRMSKSFDRRKDADAVGLAVRSLRKEARAWFNRKSYNQNEEIQDDDLLAKASAWYHVTYHYTYWGRYNAGMNRDHFLSFPWCVYDKLVYIKKYKASVTRLQHEFNPGLLLV